MRGFLSGALLGFATSVAFTANAQGLPPIVGAVLFPCGFAMIVILGLELVTGSFAMVPAALLTRGIGIGRVLGNLIWSLSVTSSAALSMRSCTPRSRRSFITRRPPAPRR